MTSEIIQNAIETLKLKNSLSKKDFIKTVKQKVTYNNSTSVSLSNPEILDNIGIAIHKSKFDTNKKILKYDGTLQSKNRNPDTKNLLNISPANQNVTEISKRLVAREVGDVFQEFNNEEARGDVSIGIPNSSDTKPVIVSHLISQTKFLESRVEDTTVKQRLKRLLDYFHSNLKSVASLKISEDGKLVENNFNTGITFQKYLNYIATSDKNRNLIEKPDFYDLIFGRYVESEQPRKLAGETETKKIQNFKGINISSKNLRDLKTKDNEITTDFWLKSFLKKISSVDDVITVLGSIAFCVYGKPEVHFKNQKKIYKQFQIFLNDEYINS